MASGAQPPQQEVETVAKALAAAQAVAVLTGAGASAESGVPTFRDAMTGLWAKHDPMQLATPQAFARDGALVSRWYDERRRRCLACRPNPGHEALAALERRAQARSQRFTLLTQNVDQLHQRAGSDNVVELHGSLFVWRCLRCGEEREELGKAAFAEHPPRCLRCGGARRPGVVWFGETLPAAALETALEALRRCDVFLCVGTSAVVHPAAGFAETARAHGAFVCEINPQATPASEAADVVLRSTSAKALPAIVEALTRLDAGGSRRSP